ncbi:MAG: hypothetical protein LUD51_04625 [Clostridia bacterium]|nr:hypothetical protein [Clostridia bacterium]
MKKKNSTPAEKTDGQTSRKERIKAFWTTKRFLFLAIIVSLVVCAVFYLACLITLRFSTYDIEYFIYGIIFEAVFIFLCLIVYYLAIIANSLRYRKKGSGDTD